MFGVKIKQTEDLFESAGLQRSGRYLRSNVSEAEVDWFTSLEVQTGG